MERHRLQDTPPGTRVCLLEDWCTPAEEEYLFPPLTYLEPTPEGVQTLRVDDATFTVIDVQPAQ